MVDCAYECGLAGAVGAEQSVDAASRHVEAYVVKGYVVGKRLAYTFQADDIVL